MSKREIDVTPSEAFDPKRYHWHKQIFVSDLGWRLSKNGPDSDNSLPQDEPIILQRAQEIFLSAFLVDSFTRKEISGCKERISSNTKSGHLRRTFTSVLGQLGEVFESPSWVRADVEQDKLKFLKTNGSEDAMNTILHKSEECLIYFSGLWAARDFLPQITFDVSLETKLVDAILLHFGTGLIKLDKRDRDRRRALIIANYDGMMNIVRESKSMQSLPFFAEIIPTISNF